MTTTTIEILPGILTINNTEEELDLDYLFNTRRITWTSLDKREIDIKELTDSHAVNLSKLLKRRRLHRTREIILAELERRATGSYPDGFDEMVNAYKQKPEIWRLKIYD